MINTEKIIEKLKIHFNIKSDTELSRYLDINQSTLASWKSNNNFDIIRVFEKIKDININWLLNNEDFNDKSISNNEITINDNLINDKIDEYKLKLQDLEDKICNHTDKEIIEILEKEVIELKSKLEFAEKLIYNLINK